MWPNSLSNGSGIVYYVECVKVCFESKDMRMELICEVGKY